MRVDESLREGRMPGEGMVQESGRWGWRTEDDRGELLGFRE